MNLAKASKSSVPGDKDPDEPIEETAAVASFDGAENSYVNGREMPSAFAASHAAHTSPGVAGKLDPTVAKSEALLHYFLNRGHDGPQPEITPRSGEGSA